MRGVYDPLPNFNCNDPTPFPMRRNRTPLWWRLLVGFGAGVLVVTLAACIFGMAGKALLQWLSS